MSLIHSEATPATGIQVSSGLRMIALLLRSSHYLCTWILAPCTFVYSFTYSALSFSCCLFCAGFFLFWTLSALNKRAASLLFTSRVKVRRDRPVASRYLAFELIKTLAVSDLILCSDYTWYSLSFIKVALARLTMRPKDENPSVARADKSKQDGGRMTR